VSNRKGAGCGIEFLRVSRGCGIEFIGVPQPRMLNDDFCEYWIRTCVGCNTGSQTGDQSGLCNGFSYGS